MSVMTQQSGLAARDDLAEEPAAKRGAVYRFQRSRDGLIPSAGLSDIFVIGNPCEAVDATELGSKKTSRPVADAQRAAGLNTVFIV
jgi:hypothetical protein